MHRRMRMNALGVVVLSTVIAIGACDDRSNPDRPPGTLCMNYLAPSCPGCALNIVAGTILIRDQSGKTLDSKVFSGNGNDYVCFEHLPTLQPLTIEFVGATYSGSYNGILCSRSLLYPISTVSLPPDKGLYWNPPTAMVLCS